MRPARCPRAGRQAEVPPSSTRTLKYPVRNRAVLRELRRLRAGQWKKVIKQGSVGEVHYFEHKSGSVAGVKFFSRQVTL